MPDQMAAPAGLPQLLLCSCALQLFVWGIAVLMLSSSPTEESPMHASPSRTVCVSPTRLLSGASCPVQGSQRATPLQCSVRMQVRIKAQHS